MPTIHMLIGIPGSGKSTYSKNVLIPKYPNAIYISSDKVRDNNPNMSETEIWPEIFRLVSLALKDNKDVIYDATNITPKVRDNFKKNIAEHGIIDYELIGYFFHTDPKICEQRVILRNKNPNERFLPIEIISGYDQKLVFPLKEENFKHVFEIDNNKDRVD